MRLYRSRVPSTNANGVLEPYTENEMIASLNEAYSSPAREPWGWRGPSTSTSPSAQGSRRITLAAANPEGDPSPDPFKYARIPQRVLIDRNLKPRDVCVYGALSGSVWQGNVASMGKRAIAQFAHCAERLVTDSLKNLVRTGHLRKYPVQHGQRGVYELLSSVFGQKQRAGYEEMVMDPSGNRRLVSVRPQRSASRTRR
jgi:hypothetical protein